MRYYIIFFIIYEILLGFYFYNQYENKIDDKHQDIVKLVKHTLDSTVNTFELANDDFHSQHAYHIAKLINNAHNASVDERDKIREKLLQSFMPFYTIKKLYAMEGMHIFDKNGHSLLRFHKPTKYDDYIIDLRNSLKNMGRDFLYKKGLEIGVYKEAYRFQYPLFYDGEFVGSFEYSISFNALQKEMKKFLANQYVLIINADDIDLVSSAKTKKERYIKVNIADKSFYYQKILFQNNIEKKYFNYILTLNEVKNTLDTKSPKIIDYSLEGKNFNVVIYPMHDISDKHIGYMFVNLVDDHVRDFRYELLFNILLASLLSVILYIYIRKQIKHKLYVRELINMQNDMLVVTDGERIKDANKTLVEFFGYATLIDFQKEHSCVCDFFIEEEGFVQKYNEDIIWIKYIFLNPDKKHRVKIKDISNAKDKIFELEYKSIENLKYIFILFRDITQEFEEYNQLLNRAYYDPLTSIYNRGSFEYHLAKELKRSSRSNEAFSLIMFDIDHFKIINDTYGHDIGDIVLKELTSLVSTHIREIDIFARWGGEEFMIISMNDINDSELFAEKLREVIENHRFSDVGKVTCSFGVTKYHKEDTVDSIVKRCDNMLYSAKKSGRNCVVSIR